MNFNNKKWLWIGRVMFALGALFMLFDCVVHLTRIPPVVLAFQQMGYSPSVILPLSIIELICIVLYIIPRTSILGAILLTGYLGGAVDANVRSGNPLSIMLFPVCVAIVLWGALYLRSNRLRSLVPIWKND